MNPITYVLQAGRNLLAGTPQDTGYALLAVLAMFVVLIAWALTGVRSAERSGGEARI